MKEELISLETAKLAKEKGFKLNFCVELFYPDPHKENEYITTECIHDWEFVENNDTYSRPTQSLLQKWLREEHNLHFYIDTTPSFEQMESHKSKYKLHIRVPFSPFKSTTAYYYLESTYEEVLEKGLQEALKLIN